MTYAEWEEYNMDNIMRTLLRTVENETDPGDPETRPFVTSYQLALMLQREYREVSDSLGFPIGGSGAGGSNTLAGEIGFLLSTRIRFGHVTDIECQMLSRVHGVTFRIGGQEIASSVSQVTMYRIRE